MKLYRVQAKYKNILVDEMLEAENDKAALDTFATKVESGDITEKDAGGFLDPNRVFITFEEVDRNATTKVNIGKTSAGVQMGQPSIISGESNS
tara:strand:- start:1305 stop:1583 length:279 start_codon:yes stop_codon:yes gene_type:complete